MVEELPFVHDCWDGYVEESHHHFVGGLISPGDGLGRIGVVRIVFGIVVPGNGAQFRSRLDDSRLSQAIAQLPVKMIIDPQEGFDAAVLVEYVVFEALAAQMHVGEKAEQGGIVGESALHFDTKVVGTVRIISA